MKTRDYQICTNCVMDTTDPQIVFDETGKCDFCNNYYNTILPSWHPDAEGEKELLKIAEKIKKETKGKKYNCIIGFSGGVDSSYLCYIVKVKMGLNPLLVSVDTGWNLNVAVENIERIVQKLKLDLYTEVINQLYAQGHEIILFTARGYVTGIDWREVTEKQLSDWGLSYHELHFGKPNADYYVDDRMLDMNVLLEMGEKEDEGSSCSKL